MRWQTLTNDDKHYYKSKADQDKLRYLKESKYYYDEVEKLGKRVGTVKTKDGKVVIAAT